jgi:hypothetical protein
MGHTKSLELERAGEGVPAPLSPVVRYALYGLLALGIALRLRLYLFNPSLWLDEATLALDLMKGAPIGQQILRGHTALCPMGFLLMTHASIRAFGTGEYALRLVPLLAGLAAFVPFYFLARRCLGPVGLMVALCLFALSPAAVRYAATLKPYSMDLAVSAALAYLGVLTLGRKVDLRWAALLGASGAVAVWFSFAAALVLAGIGAVLGGSALVRRRWGRALLLSGVGLVWLLSVGAYFFLTLRSVGSRQPLLAGWQSAFMPLPPTSAADLRWFLTTASGVLHDPFGLDLVGLSALAFIVGLVSLAGRSRELALALVAPIGAALLASGLRLYAFQGRLLLFALPFVFVPVAEGASQVWAGARGKRHLIGALFIALLVGPPAARAVAGIIWPGQKEESRPVFAYVAQHRRPGDGLYLSRYAYPAFRYYGPGYGLDQMEIMRGAAWRGDATQYEGALQRLSGRGRVWFVFSHVEPGEQEAYLRGLDRLGTRLDSFHRPEAAAYLYDLPPEPRAGPSAP